MFVLTIWRAEMRNKKGIYSIITLILLVSFFLIGYTVGRNNSSNQDLAKSNRQKKNTQKGKEQNKVIKINKSAENQNWKATITKISIQKLETKKKKFTYYISDDNHVLDERAKWHYRNEIQITLENKSGKNLDTSSYSGQFSLVDGNNNSRTSEGKTLNSFVYSPISDSSLDFPRNSKTETQIVVLGNENNFNYKHLRIILPDFSVQGDNSPTTDNMVKGGELDFN